MPLAHTIKNIVERLNIVMRNYKQYIYMIGKGVVVESKLSNLDTILLKNPYYFNYVKFRLSIIQFDK